MQLYIQKPLQIQERTQLIIRQTIYERQWVNDQTEWMVFPFCIIKTIGRTKLEKINGKDCLQPLRHHKQLRLKQSWIFNCIYISWNTPRQTVILNPMLTKRILVCLSWLLPTIVNYIHVLRKPALYSSKAGINQGLRFIP